MSQSPTVRVRAVPGRLVPHERDPRRYIGLRAVSGKERDRVEESTILHRIPGVRFDGAKRDSKELDVVFVDAGPVEVERTSYIERSLIRGDLVEALPEPAASVVAEGLGEAIAKGVAEGLFSVASSDAEES
jgi:hypothetical protein